MSCARLKTTQTLTCPDAECYLRLPEDFLRIAASENAALSSDNLLKTTVWPPGPVDLLGCMKGLGL